MLQRKKSSRPDKRDTESLWHLKRWVLCWLEPHYLGQTRYTYREDKFRYRCKQKSRRYRKAYGELINQILRDEVLLTELISEVATLISMTALRGESSK
jgi:hypothetical protein